MRQRSNCVRWCRIHHRQVPALAALDLVRDHSAICHCSPSIAACRRQFGTNSVDIFRQPGNWKLVSQRAPRKIRVFLQALFYVFIVKV